MEAAGQALRWIRHLCPARTPEPAAWRSLGGHPRGSRCEHAELARGLGGASPSSGSALSRTTGATLSELDRCIRCGRPCPEGRSAFLDAAGGGAGLHELRRCAPHDQRRASCARGPCAAWWRRAALSWETARGSSRSPKRRWPRTPTSTRPRRAGPEILPGHEDGTKASAVRTHEACRRRSSMEASISDNTRSTSAALARLL